MANELNWYSAMNLALADTSTVNRRCASILFAVKQLLTHQAMGALYGPLGAPPAGAAGTVRGSSDGVTAGMDNVDRWTDVSKVIRATVITAGTPFSWIVIQIGAYYVTLAWAWNGSGTTEWQATFKISKNLPTGGSVSAIPTATDEGLTGNNHIFAQSNGGTGASWVGGRAHYTVAQAPSGQWMPWIAIGRNGSGEFTSLFGLQEKKGSHATDQFKGILCVEGSSLDAGNNGTARDSGNMFAATTGSSMIGRSLLNAAAVRYCFTYRAFSGTTAWAAAFSADQQTGEYHRLYAELLCSTTGYYGRSGGGTLYDVEEIHRAAHGSTFPATGDQEKMAIGSLLFPFTAPPTI